MRPSQDRPGLTQPVGPKRVFLKPDRSHFLWENASPPGTSFSFWGNFGALFIRDIHTLFHTFMGPFQVGPPVLDLGAGCCLLDLPKLDLGGTVLDLPMGPVGPPNVVLDLGL